MSTKNVKAGLSKANVNAIAGAIGTATLNRLVPIFSTSVAYEKGQYTNYNNQLYRFTADKAAGAWDSSKVESASLNDLIHDVNEAVAFVNDKANVDGNYPTMTVGVADQLSPYDEESGDDQDEPFSFQATGTGNGTQPDFATGAIALMKEKRGNSVVVNQLVQNNNFANGTSGFAATGGSVTASNNVATFLATQQKGLVAQYNIPSIVGHKIYYSVQIKLTTATTKVDTGIRGDNRNTVATTEWQTISFIHISNPNHSGNEFVQVRDTRESDWDAIQIKNFVYIDLTQWFNGDIPQDLLDHPENFFRYYQGSLAYNTGELVNANGRYIKCIGMNQWDEEAEVGSLIGGTLNSKNYIRVNPNTDYYLKAPYACGIVYYDKDKQEIRRGVRSANSTFTTPSNCIYIKFYCSSDYGNTYKHDISINLYYEDEARCLTYEPYEVLTNNDTGSETLRQAGSVKDYKTPDGTIHRLAGYGNLEDLTWTDDGTFFIANVSGITSKAHAQITSDKYVLTSSTTWGDMLDGEIGKLGADNTTIRVKTRTSPTGTFYFELATPTTEQGTPYSENLVIDDFGSMDFGGTNGVPQGNLIFYPVDYKAFIDTLYNYTTGTPSNIALKSDLSADKSELQGVDTALQNAIGGTLRQCLCVKETLDFEDTDFVDLGELNYDDVTESNSSASQSLNTIINKPSSNSEVAKLLTTRYKTVSRDNIFVDDNSICVNIGGNIIIHSNALAGKTGTQVKEYMKGVLLAYEKASE